VNLAHHAAIAPLLSLFPASLDKLQPETSPIDGDTPILLAAGADDPLQALFRPQQPSPAAAGAAGGGRGAAQGGAAAGGEEGPAVQFGAEQVILVYGAARQQEVQQLVGDAALVMTVQESKGLEFKVRKSERRCCWEPGAKGRAASLQSAATHHRAPLPLTVHDDATPPAVRPAL
jgi:hypothetical protein